jgi:hypothetical protein
MTIPSMVAPSAVYCGQKRRATRKFSVKIMVYSKWAYPLGWDARRLIMQNGTIDQANDALCMWARKDRRNMITVCQLSV